MSLTSEGAAEGGWSRSLAVFLIAIAILGPSILGRELVPPDEPRFARIAQTMHTSGDWVLPVYDGRVYLDKPPLLIWLQSLLLGALGRWPEAAARLPSLLATALLAAMIHRAGRRWFDEKTGFLGALVFTSSLLVLERGAWCSTDALLACAVFGTVLALDGEPSRGRSIAGGLGLGLGLLAKGPVALLFVLLALVAGRLPGAQGPLPRRLLSPWVLAGATVVVTPWLWAAASRTGISLLIEALWHHSGERLVRSWDNIEPWWYQPAWLLLGLFPWSIVVLPLLLPSRLKRWLGGESARWLALWALAATAFFSLPGGKRGVYLLPVYPALALLVARGIPLLEEWAPGRRVAAAALAGVGLLAALLGLSILLSPGGLVPLPPTLAGEPMVRRGAGALMLGLGISLFGAGALSLGGRRALAGGPLAFALLTGTLWPVLLTPAVNAGQGARAFSGGLARHLPPGAAVAVASNKRDLLFLYGCVEGPVLHSPTEVRTFLLAGGPRVVVGTAAEIGSFADWPPGTRVLYSGRLGRDRLLAIAAGISASFSLPRDSPGAVSPSRPPGSPRAGGSRRGRTAARREST